ncbi:Uma2 family endonuclease [Crossiella equi]|uniref:Uma2 family endonuclease n=1 Tax=Crossiella equi TaxID=130796 RepID=A0ABS5AR51_9PSEU|nr:Uma2 family endonuclease [Crossiella equi]MBP2478704.1 Uma2 family endonuclease [Crossiella equi]
MSAAALDDDREDEPRIGPHTVENWLALDPRADGAVVELSLGYFVMTPAPSREHQQASYRLAKTLEAALDAAERPDLDFAQAVNVCVSAGLRTALIPDLVVLNTEAGSVYINAADLQLVVEIWSPGNKLAERETKLTSYAAAGVPFLWTVDQPDDLRALPVLTAYRLVDGRYEVDQKLEEPGDHTISAAPVPVVVDLAKLIQRR